MNVFERLACQAIHIPEILIPRQDIELSSWSVIACDQFTQDRDYWRQVEIQAGSGPSTLRLIFPEVFLNDPGRGERISAIHRTMKAYLGDSTAGGETGDRVSSGESVFEAPGQGIMYIERSTPRRPCRRGLILAIDLEHYDWAPEARTLIRTTEGTVPERIPPRMEIRRGAALESPHILLLIDDPGDRVMGILGETAKKRKKAYNGTLMLSSGSVAGWFLDKTEDFTLLADELELLAGNARIRYGSCGDRASTGDRAGADKDRPEGDRVNQKNPGEKPFLFAVGDGNHSLATAKAVWEEYKAGHQGEKGLENHPGRYALVEVENIYDPGIDFEPIHRVIFGAGTELLDSLKALPGFTSRIINSGSPDGDRARLSSLIAERGTEQTRYGLVQGTRCVLIETTAPGIAAVPIQPLLDAFVQNHPGCSIDYIHGTEACLSLALDQSRKAAAVLLPPVKKEDLFSTVAQSGPLPRKSFSMGEAREKRFYLECRKLFRE
ncbi:MAG: DUF1015 domain-containing protein [Spirochaetaceae bacterium]|jgi:hypothetical protein|nr:DUF1015 domain-containing protein [Spirochaetaceae bacterium]